MWLDRAWSHQNSLVTKYLQVSQLAIFLVDTLLQEKCVRQEVVPGDKEVLIWSPFLSALLLRLTPWLLLPIREYQHLTCLVFKEKKCLLWHRCADLMFSSVKLHETNSLLRWVAPPCQRCTWERGQMPASMSQGESRPSPESHSAGWRWTVQHQTAANQTHWHTHPGMAANTRKSHCRYQFIIYIVIILIYKRN